MKLRRIVRTATFKHTTVTTVSTLINAGLGALFYFFLAYSLGPHNYGIFTLFASLIALFYGIVDLGSDQGLVKFIPKYKNDRGKQMAFMKLSLRIKLISGFITLALLVLFREMISRTILNQPLFGVYIPLVGLGVISQLLFSYSTSLSQALEKFFVWGGLFVGTNLMRLIFVLLYFRLGILTSFSSSILYILFPLLGFIASFLFFDRTFLKTSVDMKLLKELFGFNKWVVAFLIVSTVGSRLEVFYTTRYLGFTLVGIYGLVQQISSILVQLTTAVGAVTSPRFASFTNNIQNRKYTLKAILLTGTIGFLALMFLIPFGYIILGVSGSGYKAGFIPFIILLMAMAVFFVTAPVRDSIIYYFGKPKFFFWIGIGHAMVITLFSVYLIPKYLLTGTSMVVMAGQIFIALSSTVYYYILGKSK